jgi:type II secretory pathway component PulJ
MSKLRTRRKPSISGLTVTELIVVSALMSSLSAMVYSTFVHQTRTYRQQSAQSMTQDKLRTWVDRMVKDIRRAGYDPGESGIFGIESFSTTEFRFTADDDADGVLDSGSEYHGYKFEDDTVYRRTGQDAWRPLLTGVGGLSFTYRDVQGQTVSTVASAVSFVEVALSVEATQPSSEGYDTAPAGVPAISVGEDRTTITAPSESGAPVYVRVDRAALRNPL